MDVVTFTPTEPEADTEYGLGALATARGNLPLRSIDAAVSITGLLGRTVLTQSFHNPFDVELEATYIFPLPDRAAVTAMRLTADGRVIEAELGERAQARAAYDQAIATGHRAAIAEEERPDVFTMRVGNILAGEQVSVELVLIGPLSYEDGEASYRLPLVVAPRYIPGVALAGNPVGAGWADDTASVPDASRISPPVLLPGFPHPVRLSIGVDIDPLGLPLGEVRSSLHTVVREGQHLEIRPGERVDRDFILRIEYGLSASDTHTLTLVPDRSGPGGTFQLTLIPPVEAALTRPRDVVLILDRSGSMQGWKMVAARRAAARIVDTLTASDRFAVLTFDTVIDQPERLPEGLVEATDRNRYRAVEHLARVEARGGTELLRPLAMGVSLLADAVRDRVVVLVTDGQVGNEDEILAGVSEKLNGIRVHTVGIDQAVNAGFLGRLAALGGGRCELVESEDRLDAAMDHIHRRIGAPVVTGIRIGGDVADIDVATVSPARPADLFPGVPLVVTGRYRQRLDEVTVSGDRRDGTAWSVDIVGRQVDEPAIAFAWARAHLRDLEDSYAAGRPDAPTAAEIVAVSLRSGVLCRFTAWLAVDTRVVTEGGQVHRVVQPVEQPAGWDLDTAKAPTMVGATRMASFLPAAPMAQAVTSVAPPTPQPAGRQDAGADQAGRMDPAGPSTGSAPPGSPVLGRPSEHRLAAPGVARRKAAPVHSDGGDDLTAARGQAVAEALRLRQGAELSSADRRDLLLDLASRLDALVRHLERQGIAPDIVAPLRVLAASLGGSTARISPADLTRLWEDALRTLDEFGGDRGRTSFWTRPSR